MGIVEVRLEVDAWDCFLYSGLLFVLTSENELRIYDWERIIEKIRDAENHLAITCALARSDYVYSGEWKLGYTPDAFFTNLRASIRAACRHPYVLTADAINDAILFRESDPIEDLSSSLSIYKNALFLSDDNGVFTTSFYKGRNYVELGNPEKIWDGRAVSFAGGSYSAVAVGAGSEGLYRYRTIDETMPYQDAGEISALSQHHTTSVDWTQLGFFRSSSIAPGELLTTAPAKKTQSIVGKRTGERALSSVLFDVDGVDYSWGARDRIFTLVGSSLRVYRYNSKKVREAASKEPSVRPSSVLELEKSIRLQHWKGNVISAGASSFGAVIECENAIIVVNSSAEALTISHRAARWRTYNRAKYYQNQLHLIGESDIIIMGFTDDFFLDSGKERPLAVSRVT